MMEYSAQNDPDNNCLKTFRRHLPHWTQKGSLYFITFNTLLTHLSIEEQSLALEHLKDGDEKFYSLFAVVVMPDHIHLIFTPKDELSISRIMRGIKGVTARKINLRRGKTGSVWHNEYYDRIIRNDNELLEKLHYMLFNPVEKGLIKDPWAYRGWYLNEKCDIL